ncbi:hypothetical protein QQ045_023454 [Rhodiola kirilowii]
MLDRAEISRILQFPLDGIVPDYSNTDYHTFWRLMRRRDRSLPVPDHIPALQPNASTEYGRAPSTHRATPASDHVSSGQARCFSRPARSSIGLDDCRLLRLALPSQSSTAVGTGFLDCIF